MMPPPRGQSSWAWETRSSSPYTTFSTKPNASTRNRIRARASRARRVGHTCGGGLSVMCPIVGRGHRGVLDKTDLVGHPPGRCHPGQRVELPVEVRLVEVTGTG